MSEPKGSELPEDRVLWDVVEEHLAEAEFLVEQLEGAFDSPTLTVKRLEDGIEARLAAHLDGLVVGEAPVFARLLEPILADPDPEQPTLVTVAGLVAVESGRFRDLDPALVHEAPSVRAAAINACSMGEGPGLDGWIQGRLRDVPGPKEQAALLRIAARRGIETPPFAEWLEASDPALLEGALEAARHADPPPHRAAVESLLDHEDQGVREAALVTALAWGSRRASAVCEALALGDVPRPLPMALYAALGGQPQHERLARRLTAAHRRSALFALGFSCNPAMLPALLEHLAGDDPTTAKIAAQAISTITGLDLEGDTFAANAASPPPEARELPAAKDDPEAQRSLPPLEEDDLDADLTPAPEDALPDPGVAAIRRFCETAARKLPPGRILHGKPLTTDALLDSLEHAPLRRRHVLALWLGIQTGGKRWVDTRAFSREQRRRVAAARALR